jgi:hypothetical protein
MTSAEIPNPAPDVTNPDAAVFALAHNVTNPFAAPTQPMPPPLPMYQPQQSHQHCHSRHTSATYPLLPPQRAPCPVLARLTTATVVAVAEAAAEAENGVATAALSTPMTASAGGTMTSPSRCAVITCVIGASVLT